MHMRYVVETGKSVENALEDLKESVSRHRFGVLNVMDLKKTLESKGHPIDNACYILDVCNPAQAEKVLKDDMGMNIALPCRMTVYEDGGNTWFGMVRPADLLGGLSDSPVLKEVAVEVEETMKAIMEDAR